ncbi:fructose-1,6-bisphosphatase [Proteiniclasticum sp. BAD-10]|uniref:Fructose-1,6-bisphosphatase class 3 n=1 Tax=Proteiniclasticum sediminis TaxID=2804028 RepID=A0A941CRH7_9CLOT|nr:fructose-1,6-bisphosphatase [Proteiniclasticum sediminis]MBR0576006.1 fructose-1,6-bisphosphatase [Proteiniclasticum sediminis]
MTNELTGKEVRIIRDLDYLALLARQHPTINSATTEIINLQAILDLPKGTEHFISDIHGEFESFRHVLKNASGVIRNKINEIFGNTLRESEKRSLATLIYYPEEKLDMIDINEREINDWYRIHLFRLIQVCKTVSSKYTRSKVRKAFPKEFAYILDELINENEDRINKYEYYNKIIETIIDLDRARSFIIAISNLIQRFAVDRLHIIGDIYDRGQGPDIIMDMLKEYHSLDIQWGNHDMIWMGAAAGNEALIANVVRITSRYNHLELLEDRYGINLLPLATFAMDTYGSEELEKFMPRGVEITEKNFKEMEMVAKIHKAIFIIQLKLEAEIIYRHPEYGMNDRMILDMINYEAGTITLGDKEFPLNSKEFPTVDPENPFILTEGEKTVVDRLKRSFMNSLRLNDHVKLLFSKGSMYKVFNGNLLLHGCIPMTEDGEFLPITIQGVEYAGKAALDELDRMARQGYFSIDPEAKEAGLDAMWYLWCGPASPLFGKKKMATFERYFIEDKTTHVEVKNPYYSDREKVECIVKILEEFGLDTRTSHLVNGHVPVKVVKGESPIKADGKLLVIDGGFAKAYQKETGIAGYTLIYNSHGMNLVSHEPFESTEKAIMEEKDIVSTVMVLESARNRRRVSDTDTGEELRIQVDDLLQLVAAYRKGYIKESIHSGYKESRTE